MTQVMESWLYNSMASRIIGSDILKRSGLGDYQGPLDEHKTREIEDIVKRVKGKMWISYAVLQ
jgi:hypothetical protein